MFINIEKYEYLSGESMLVSLNKVFTVTTVTRNNYDYAFSIHIEYDGGKESRIHFKNKKDRDRYYLQICEKLDGGHLSLN